MNIRRHALVLTLVIITSTFIACDPRKESSTTSLAPGMQVVAQWQGDSWWVATIDGIDGNNVTLTYSDGEKGVRDRSQVFPYPKRSNP